jgi:hypothetical protein
MHLYTSPQSVQAIGLESLKSLNRSRILLKARFLTCEAGVSLEPQEREGFKRLLKTKSGKLTGNDLLRSHPRLHALPEKAGFSTTQKYYFRF